jgi:hypothetical protein
MSEERYPISRVEQWSARLNRMPRVLRMVISLIITLELVVLAWLLIAAALDIDIFDPDPDLTLPLLLVTVLGLVFYGVGWWAMVGFDSGGPWQAGTPAVIFSAAGCAGFILVIMLVLLGLAFGYIL